MFCRNCGAKLREGARFCVSCGASSDNRAPEYNQNQNQHVTNTSYNNVRKADRPKKKIGGKIIAVLVSLLLIFYGIVTILNSLIGVRTTALVTNIEQSRNVDSEDGYRDPNKYTIYYSYSAKGKSYSGSVDKRFKSGYPSAISTLEIKYLPFLPHISNEISGFNIILSILLLALGTFLAYSSLKPSRTR